MTDYNVFELRSGDLLYVPASAAVMQYRLQAPTPVFGPDVAGQPGLVIEGDALVALQGSLSERTPKVKRRKQRHPRTPKKWWKRRRLAMAEGPKAAAEAEGVSVTAIYHMAEHYHWKLPKPPEVSNG